jgi:hypothetical protein
MEIEIDKKVWNEYFVVKNVHLNHNHQNSINLITEDNLHFLIQFHEYEYLLNFFFFYSIKYSNLFFVFTFELSVVFPIDFVLNDPMMKINELVL